MAEGGAWFEDEIGPTLEVLSLGVLDDPADVFESMIPEIVGYAQANAPWDDRTGEAREGLDAEVVTETGAVELVLFHTAEHGFWLELIQSGRFAIIMPTLETFAPMLFSAAGGAIVGEEGGDL